MTDRINALEAEIEAAQAEINTASLMAATESRSPADRLKKARAILEQKELLKLARDDWRDPPEPEREGPVEYEEDQPEEITHAV